MKNSHRASIALASLFVLVLVACSDVPPSAESSSEESTPPEPESAEYRAEIEAWQKDRDESLTDPEGWLTLAGLFWLQPRENVAGSDLAYDIPLPESVPARLGSVHYRPDAAEGERVELVLAEGVSVEIEEDEQTATIDDRAFLRTDAEGAETGGPSVVRIGPVSFFAIERGEQVGLRVRDRESRALTEFHGVPRYPVDEAWRVEARFEPHDPPKTIGVPTVLGTVLDQESPGRVVFEKGGESYALDALPAGDDEVWLLFADATNADETYGSGRFLYADIAPETLASGGAMVVDFNRAYNPPCAFTPYATCPLPPAGNELALRVEAGEKRYGSGAH